jgi:hypothetical protein
MKLNTARTTYDKFNAEIFSNLLVRPVFRRTRARYEYASYVPGFNVYYPSIIFINLNHVNGNNVRSIIYHEMIHQYVEEFLRVEESDHHGPEFWRNYRLFKPSDVVLFEELD